jgi:VanZ family protein
MITVMGIIFFLSSQTGDTLDLPDIPDLDKLLHAIAYGVLALTVLFAVPGHQYRKHPWRISLSVVLFCLLYGISDEFHQSFVPGRMPSVLDLTADTLGAVVAAVLWFQVKTDRTG